ncbi:hypothetical protein QAD02_013773 [Eretmocerus hayati]|uniref:Uncharacterized protein n=1 Tax=Eretmocerus hayati TaxID=131215 RepID=A0ACC2P4H7_9HYME|nr:hypothetical protein QAD02_013773 [Eretmocerus hayati]
MGPWNAFAQREPELTCDDDSDLVMNWECNESAESNFEPQNSMADLKLMASLIPDFTGDPDSVDHFARACSRADRKVTEKCRDLLLEIIIRKCKRKAQEYLSGGVKYFDVNNSLADLRREFGSRDDYNQLNSMLARVVQKPNETV